MANIYTKILTLFQGRVVGEDPYGNRYYQSRKPSLYGRHRRWIIYANEDDGAEVPPGYHAWLHGNMNALPTQDEKTKYPVWHLSHQGNKTGTLQVWRPAAAYAGGTRAKARSDYLPWRPE